MGAASFVNETYILLIPGPALPIFIKQRGQPKIHFILYYVTKHSLTTSSLSVTCPGSTEKASSVRNPEPYKNFVNFFYKHIPLINSAFCCLCARRSPSSGGIQLDFFFSSGHPETVVSAAREIPLPYKEAEAPKGQRRKAETLRSQNRASSCR